MDLELSGKRKAVAIAAVVVIGGAVVAEEFLLKGKKVYSKYMVGVNSSGTELDIPIQYPGEKHSVEVRSRGSRKDVALSFSMLDPGGAEFYSRNELKSRKSSRMFKFTPLKAGTYTLLVKLGPTNLLGGRSSVSVTITIRDRRILAPIFGWF